MLVSTNVTAWTIRVHLFHSKCSRNRVGSNRWWKAPDGAVVEPQQALQSWRKRWKHITQPAPPPPPPHMPAAAAHTTKPPPPPPHPHAPTIQVDVKLYIYIYFLDSPAYDHRRQPGENRKKNRWFKNQEYAAARGGGPGHPAAAPPEPWQEATNSATNNREACGGQLYDAAAAAGAAAFWDTLRSFLSHPFSHNQNSLTFF